MIPEENKHHLNNIWLRLISIINIYQIEMSSIQYIKLYWLYNWEFTNILDHSASQCFD